MVEQFNNSVLSVMDQHVPKKILNSRKAPWHDKTFQRLKNRKNKEYKRWIMDSTEDQLLRFLHWRDELEQYDELAYESYVNKMGSAIKSNPKLFWKFVNYKRNVSGYPAMMSFNKTACTNINEICDKFGEFFQSVYQESEQQFDLREFAHLPLRNDFIEKLELSRENLLIELTKLDNNKNPGPDGIPSFFLKMTASNIVDPLIIIFNKSLCEGYFPITWRSSNIIPIFKSGDRTIIENYRGIAKLSVIPKLFEKMVTDQIMQFLSNEIAPEQHGFRKGFSTTTNLVSYTSDLLYAMKNNIQVDAIYTDFSKAFDKVDHGLLIMKLNKMGIRNKLLQWIKSYLSKRTQKVKINGISSSIINVTSGVPQGSHLGPILFNVFINDLTSKIKFCKYLLYADDMKLYKEINCTSDAELIQNDINSVQNWCKANFMYLNVSKCNIVTFSKKSDIITFDYYIEDKMLIRKSSIIDLGVILDSKLNFGEHIDTIVNRGHRMLGFIKRRSKEFNDPYITKAIYSSLVRSHLEYASVVWNGIGITASNRIESVQKQFLLFALRNLGWRTDSFVLPPYVNRLKLIDLEPLHKRRRNFDCTFAFDLLKNNIKSMPMCEKMNLNPPLNYQLRSRPTLLVPMQPCNYLMNEPYTRVSRSFNESRICIEPLISRNCFKKKLRTL